MNNVLELLRKLIKDSDSTLDVSSSSALSDVIINPSASMLSPFLSQLRYLLKNLTMVDVVNIAEDELDAIGANFLVYRFTGAKARGKVRMYFNKPVDITIPVGTKFYTRNGLIYLTEQPYAVTRGTMLADVSEFPLYSTGDFDVIAEQAGEVYVIPPGTVVSTDLATTYSKVKNILAFAGGLDKETNEEYYTRILNAMTNESIASPDGISKILLNNFPSIQNVHVAGANDSLMTRDILYSGLNNFSGYHVVDYYGKVSGYNDAPFPESRAYTTFVSGLTVGDLPDLTDFEIELSTDKYKNLYLKDDVLKLTVDSQYILSEDFSGTNFNANWFLSDSNRGLGRAYTDTITIADNNRAQLGRLVDINELSAANIALIELNKLYNDVATNSGKYLSGSYSNAFADLPVIQSQIDAATMQILELNAGTNCVPILHTSIPIHNNIQIDGLFNTTDYADLNANPKRFGQMSYITVLRNGSVASSVDGYGLAWRVGDGSKYNIYIVDNNTLSEGTYLGQAGMAFNTEGVDDYLVAAKKEILPNTDYNYRIVIYENFQMDVWLWETSNTGFVPTDGNRIIWKGAYSPRAIQNEAVTTESHTHFGISVLGTNKALWYYDSITIKALDRGHPAVLYQLHANSSEFPSGAPFTLNWYGYGKTTDDTYGANLYIYNYANEGTAPWTLIGSNTRTESDEIDNTIVSGIFTMSTDYRDPADNKINVLAVTQSSLFSPAISTYYINMHTGMPSGIHVGGMADIYVNSPSDILLDSVSVSLDVNNIIGLTADNGFKLPIQEIVSITDNIGTELLRVQDWTLMNENPSTTWSEQEQFTCTFVESPVIATVKYRYYSDYETVQNLISSDQYRYVGNDNLIKLMPPAIISVNQLEYRDGPTIEQAQELIKNYINSLTTTLEISDIINLLSIAGVTYINLDTINISIREYDDLKRLVKNETITNSYTLPEFRAFYTDSLEMTGLVKL
jgi:hypothetical protein